MRLPSGLLLSCLFLPCLFLLVSTSPLRANDQVELELLTTEGAAATAAHDWLAALRDLEFAALRIRQVRPGEAPAIEQSPGGNYHVVGLITRDNRLRLPHGTFRMSQREAIASWMETLIEGGEQAFTEEQAAFGLRSSEFLALYEQLAVPVAAETSGGSTADVVQAIAADLPLELTYSAAARAALRGGDPVADELQGITSGTALAAALRPLGLVLVPEKSGGTVRLRVAESDETVENWPVGWPSEEPLAEVMPKLLDFLDVEIDDQPLLDVLAALDERLETPMLWDHNSLARRQIDPVDSRVTIPAGRTFYQQILRRALGQSNLKFELRVDEAGQPLLWLTTR